MAPSVRTWRATVAGPYLLVASTGRPAVARQPTSSDQPHRLRVAFGDLEVDHAPDRDSTPVHVALFEEAMPAQP
jgi:hypothetical protein